MCFFQSISQSSDQFKLIWTQQLGSCIVNSKGHQALIAGNIRNYTSHYCVQPEPAIKWFTPEGDQSWRSCFVLMSVHLLWESLEFTLRFPFVCLCQLRDAWFQWQVCFSGCRTHTRESVFSNYLHRLALNPPEVSSFLFFPTQYELNETEKQKRWDRSSVGLLNAQSFAHMTPTDSEAGVTVWKSCPQGC